MRYESMMVVDSAVARADSAEVSKLIQNLIKKCDGSDVDIEVYGERKLAYTIGKRTRGAYYLVHFDMDGADVPKLHRELKLNDDIFRHMILHDGDAGLERRDLSNPRQFNVDSSDSKYHFEKFDNKRVATEVVEKTVVVEKEKEVVVGSDKTEEVGVDEA